MSQFNDQITKLVNDFVAQVANLARRAAMDTLEHALAGAGTGRAPAGRGRGRAAVSLAGPSSRRPKGAKRPPGEIARTKTRVYEYIRTHPGQRIEQINKALGTTTKDLTLPIKKLIADKAVKHPGREAGDDLLPGRRQAVGGRPASPPRQEVLNLPRTRAVRAPRMRPPAARPPGRVRRFSAPAPALVVSAAGPGEIE